MHNKSFTADNWATIVGGRNVGDEYFGAKDGVLFADYDVLAVGPVVDEIARDFDRYWNSSSSYPADLLLAAGTRRASASPVPAVGQGARLPSVDLARTLDGSEFARQWKRGSIPFWAPAYLVSDDPAKGLGLAPSEPPIVEALLKIIGTTAAQLDIVSPYFVPT